MTVATLTPAFPPRGRVTLARVIDSEWIKLRTLRSSWLTLLGAVVSMLAIGLVVAVATTTSKWSTLQPDDTAASATLQGFHLAQLLIGVLGILFVSGEYATGMIRSTFAAVPRRLPVLAAKWVVFGAVSLVVMTATSFATFFSAQAILSAHGHGSSLADPGALRAVAGTGVYLALVGLLAGAFGWIVRSTAGAISGLLGLLLILPVILRLLPGTFTSTVAEYLPSNAGEAFVISYHNPNLLSPWAGLGVFTIWVAAAMAAAIVIVRRRDA